MNALARTFPGQRIYVPFSSDDAIDRFTRNFSPLVGEDGVAALIDLFGGLRFTVPTRRTPQRHKGFVPVDVRLVASLTLQNLSAPQIALRLQCDPRSVHKARTKAKEMGLLNKPKRKGAKR